MSDVYTFVERRVRNKYICSFSRQWCTKRAKLFVHCIVNNEKDFKIDLSSYTLKYTVAEPFFKGSV